MKYTKFIIIIGILIIGSFGLYYQLNKDISKINKTFKSESAYWNATYQVKGYVQFYKENGVLNSKSEGTSKLILTYKGTLEDLTNLRTISIKGPNEYSSLTSDTSPSNIEFSFTDNLHILTIIDISKDKPIELEVTWDGDNGTTETLIFQ